MGTKSKRANCASKEIEITITFMTSEARQGINAEAEKNAKRLLLAENWRDAVCYSRSVANILMAFDPDGERRKIQTLQRRGKTHD